MTPDRLREIRERVEKATAGPWMVRGPGGIMGGKFYQYTNGSAQKQILSCCVMDEDNGSQKGNTEFVVNARQDIPWLLEQLESAQAELARLKADVAKVTTEATIESMSKLDKYGNRIK